MANEILGEALEVSFNSLQSMYQNGDVHPNTTKLSLMTKEFLKQSTVDVEDPLLNNNSKQVANNIDN